MKKMLEKGIIVVASIKIKVKTNKVKYKVFIDKDHKGARRRKQLRRTVKEEKGN